MTVAPQFGGSRSESATYSKLTLHTHSLNVCRWLALVLEDIKMVHFFLYIPIANHRQPWTRNQCSLCHRHRAGAALRRHVLHTLFTAGFLQSHGTRWWREFSKNWMERCIQTTACISTAHKCSASFNNTLVCIRFRGVETDHATAVLHMSNSTFRFGAAPPSRTASGLQAPSRSGRDNVT